jgi:hypothetical protein
MLAALKGRMVSARKAYNLGMPRAALFTVLAASVLAGSLQAQRTGAISHGSTAGSPARSGVVGQRGLPNGFVPRRGMFPSRFQHRHGGAGSLVLPYFFPYDEPFGYEQPYAEAVTNEPVAPAGTLHPDDRPSRALEPSVPKAQVIELPAVPNSTPAKMLPPTIFLLANGERLETRRFVLTATHLFVSIDREQRTVPLGMLDINATIAANHERGIDLRVPFDRNEISLSF